MAHLTGVVGRMKATKRSVSYAGQYSNCRELSLSAVRTSLEIL